MSESVQINTLLPSKHACRIACSITIATLYTELYNADSVPELHHKIRMDTYSRRWMQKPKNNPGYTD